MLRQGRFRAALAALALPAALVVSLGPAAGAHAEPATTQASAGDDKPRPGTTARQDRPVQTSRRAVRSQRVAARLKAQRAEDDAPLKVTIDQLSPSTIPERGPIRISGTVTNEDDVTRTTINLYAFISATPMTTSAELEAAAQTDPASYVGERITDGSDDYKDSIAALAPGETRSYSFTVPRGLLGVSEPGVYWFGVHALSDDPDGGRDDVNDGRARTFMPFLPSRATADLTPEKATVVLPLRHQLVYADDGSVDDLAGWVRTLSQGGRLRSLVEFGAASGDAPVTWVVDPALVDAVRRLAAGNPPRSMAANLEQGQDDGEDAGTEAPSPGAEDPTPTETPTTDPAPVDDTDSPLDLDELDPVVQAASQAAQQWLDRLGAAMRPDDQVLTLPYGDVDVAGAAQHDPDLLNRAVMRSTLGLAGFDVATTPVVSSPSGYLPTSALDVVSPDTTVLLTDQMFRAGEQAEEGASTDGTSAVEPPAAATVDGHRVVVASHGAATGGPGPDERTAPAAMRQRLLAEAAVRFLDPSHPPLTVVVPHDWNPPEGGSFFEGLTTQAGADWLDLTTVDGVESDAAAPTVAGSTLRYPLWQSGSELSQASFDAADGLVRAGSALQSLLTLNNVVGGTVADQALGSASYSARTRPYANKASADASRTWILSRLDQVRVSSPQAVTLSSSSGRFAATLVNGLDEPVTVALDAQTDARLRIAGPELVDLPAGGRTTVLLTARTDENGVHQVRLVVTDKRGVPLGGTSDLSLRSAQVSAVIWLFMGLGAALLFGAIGLRIVRRVRDARRDAARSEPPRPPQSGPDPHDRPRPTEPAGAGTR